MREVDGKTHEEMMELIEIKKKRLERLEKEIMQDAYEMKKKSLERTRLEEEIMQDEYDLRSRLPAVGGSQ